MAHTVAIAKASLAAGFMRPDPTSINRDEIVNFHSLLEATLARCSPANIQRCKSWLAENVATSAGRVNAVGKYLVALGSSLVPEDNGSRPREKPSPRRKQLAILYILNDLLHHSKYHTQNVASISTLAANLQPHLIALFSHTAAYDTGIYLRQHKRLQELLGEWERLQYFHPQFLEKIRSTVKSAASGDKTGINQGGQAEAGAVDSKSYRDAPFIMPASHGDAFAPFYELPAGNMMPHIVPNTATPISSGQMKALQFVAGPADSNLTDAVKSLLKEVDAIYGSVEDEDEGISMDLDELGQSTFRDKATEEFQGGDSYYGWSKSFCEQMKDKINRPLERSGSRDRSRSRSRSGSMSPRKRARYRSSSRSMNESPSRSPPARFGGRERRHSSRSRSRSYSPPRFHQDRDRSRSPPRGHPLNQRTQSHAPANVPTPPFIQGQNASPSPPVPFPNPFPNGIPLGPGGMPIPPPRPPNYTGPWPPPPPPPPPPMGMAGSPGPGFPPFVPPPPPIAGANFHGGPSPPNTQGWPPPPLPQQPPQGNYSYVGNHSGHQYGDRGRGGRGGRGRGGWR